MPLTRNGKNYGSMETSNRGVADGEGGVSASSASDNLKPRSIMIDFFGGADGQPGACKYSAKCPSCLPQEVTFSTIQQWRSHHESLHHSDAGYQCPKCRSISQNWYNYTNHVQTHDDIASAWRCHLDGCNLPFANIYSLLTHWKKNHTQYIIQDIPSKSGMVRVLNEIANDSESEQKSKKRGHSKNEDKRLKRKYKHLNNHSITDGQRTSNRKRRKLETPQQSPRETQLSTADDRGGVKKNRNKKVKTSSRKRQRRRRRQQRRLDVSDSDQSPVSDLSDRHDFLAGTDFDDVSNVSARDDSTIFSTTDDASAGSEKQYREGEDTQNSDDDDEDDDLHRRLNQFDKQEAQEINFTNALSGIDLLLRAANVIDSAQSTNADNGHTGEDDDDDEDEDEDSVDDDNAMCKPPIFAVPQDHHNASSKPALFQTKLPSLTTFGSTSSTKQENQILSELCSSLPLVVQSPQPSHNATTTTSCSSSTAAMNDNNTHSSSNSSSSNSLQHNSHFVPNDYKILHQQNNIHNLLQITPNITTTTTTATDVSSQQHQQQQPGKVCIVPVQWEMLQHLQQFNQYNPPSNVISVNNMPYNNAPPQSQQLAYIHPNHNKSMISVTLIPTQQQQPPPQQTAVNALNFQPFSIQNAAAAGNLPFTTPVNLNGLTPYLQPNFNLVNATPSSYTQSEELPQLQNTNNSSVLPLPDLPPDFLNRQN